MKKHAQWVHVRQRGFALVEAMVVASIFVFGFVAANKVQVNMIKNRMLTTQESQAVNLSNQKFEQMRTYTDLTAYSGIATTSASTNAANTSYTDTLTVTNLTRYKKLDQTISWTNANGENQSMSMSSFISQNNPQYSGLLFSSSYNNTPLASPGSSLSTNTSQPSTNSTNTSSTTTDVTVPGTNIVLTYDQNNKVTEINHVQAVTFSGAIILNTGSSAPPNTVSLAAVTVLPQTSNTAVITCSYSGPTGLISCIMARGWSGSILLGGITNTNVCVSNQQPYTNLLVSISGQDYVLSSTNSICPSNYNYLLQTL